MPNEIMLLSRWVFPITYQVGKEPDPTESVRALFIIIFLAAPDTLHTEDIMYLLR